MMYTDRRNLRCYTSAALDRHSPTPPSPRPAPSRSPHAVRRSLLVSTDQLILLTRSLRGGPVFPVVSTTPSNRGGGSG
jgi:hypothetical protein